DRVDKNTAARINTDLSVRSEFWHLVESNAQWRIGTYPAGTICRLQRGNAHCRNHGQMDRIAWDGSTAVENVDGIVGDIAKLDRGKTECGTCSSRDRAAVLEPLVRLIECGGDHRQVRR